MADQKFNDPPKRGFLVSEPWFRKVDEFVEGSGGGNKVTANHLFYLLRQVYVDSQWEISSQGELYDIFEAGATLLDQSAPTRIKIYSVTQHDKPPESAAQQLGWAVYRGFWWLLGGGVSGHKTGVTVGAYGSQEGGTTKIKVGDQLYYATAPTLIVGDTLDPGTKVIISRNTDTGKWEIIQASCN